MDKVSQFVGESRASCGYSNRAAVQGSLAEGALFQAVIDVQNQARGLER